MSFSTALWREGVSHQEVREEMEKKEKLRRNCLYSLRSDNGV